MNEPRTIPYEFRVFRQDDLIYLFDKSENVYICSMTPCVWCECIHCDNEDLFPHYDECSMYLDRKCIDKIDHSLVESRDPDPDEDPDEDRIDAWDHAREMVVCNNYGGLL